MNDVEKNNAACGEAVCDGPVCDAPVCDAPVCGSRRLPLRPGFNTPFPVSVAPMMDRTDRFFRWMLRQITPNTLLYSEMVSTGAIVYGDRARQLDFLPAEKPLALQLGGSDDAELAQAVQIAEDWDYDEVNLNVGCPSDRVQHRGLGACLMADPPKVARLVEIMRKNTGKPVTVKHRVGINGRESYEELCEFVRVVAAAGVERLNVHARIAILEGLSPKENRSIPPLRYEDVYRLKQDFPRLEIEINGHIDSVAAIREHLGHVDAVMLGRAAYENPMLFAAIEQEVFGAVAGSAGEAAGGGETGGAAVAGGGEAAGGGETGGAAVAPGGQPRCVSRAQVLERCIGYFEDHWQAGMPRSPLGHIMGLYHGMPGARRWRGVISTGLASGLHPAEVLRRSLSVLPAETAPA